MVARLRGAEGVAMVSVLFATVIVLGLAAATVAYVVNTLPQTRQHEDWNAAFAAAESGVEDVIARLNQNPAYWREDDPDNPARDGWRGLESDGPGTAYHYHLDRTELDRSGFVRVISTGLVGDQTRTVEALLRREGFLDYVYFTDHEVTDPHQRFGPGTVRDNNEAICSQHRPDLPRGWGNNQCGAIPFPYLDVIDGPLRTNDNILVRPCRDGGPIFEGPVIVGTPHTDGTLFRRQTHTPPPSCDSNPEPTFQQGIRLEPRLPLPEAPSALQQAAEDYGCVYEGPTYLRFAGEQMVVYSPLSPPDPDCGGGPTGPQLVDLPDGEAIFVRNSSQPAPDDHPLGMPHPDDNQTQYSRTAGDAFVHGVVDGSVTVGTENHIQIVHDLTVADLGLESPQLIGLVSQQHTFIHHPVRHTGGSTFSAEDLPSYGRGLPPFNVEDEASSPAPAEPEVWHDPEIHASILALRRSFRVHNHNFGSRMHGQLTVIGSIAQRFRGSVGGGQDDSGYDKEYVYDTRLQFSTPPYFTEPVRSPWGVRLLAEIRTPSVCGTDEQPRDHGCLPAIASAD